MGRLTMYHDSGTADINYESCKNGLFDLLDKLAHYEDLEEQGRLITLPCAVGTELYFIGHSFRTGTSIVCPIITQSVDDCLFYEDKIGKWVFLTKEEAEAKLKELEGVKE